MWRGEGNIITSGEEYNVQERERGSSIIFPIILRLLSNGEEGEGDGYFEEEENIKKMGIGKNVKL